MVQTVYTSARDVDVKTCAPQPLIRSNYFAEFRTETEKARARRNLGINEENDLFWGNIQGFIELQKDLVDYIQRNFDYTTETQEGIATVKEALDFIFEVIVDYGSHKEDYITLNNKVENIQQEISALQEHITEIEKTFQEAIDSKTEDITKLSESLTSFKEEYNNFSEVITEQISSLEEIVSGFDERITAVEATFDLTYNTELNDSVTAPSKIGGIAAGTKVGDLKEKTLIEIVDLLVFPSTVPQLRQPYAYYNINNQTIKVGTSLSPVLNFYQGDAGIQSSEVEVITLNDIKLTDFTGYTELGTYKHIGTITYEAGKYLVDDRGNQTNQRVEAGAVTVTLIINTTYPWYVNNNEQSLIPFNKASGEINLSLEGIPVIKLPGNNSRIDSFMVDGGSGYLAVNLEGAWEESTESINGITYKVWTKKTAYVDSLPHKINFTLLE